MSIKHQVGAISLDASFALTKPWTVLFGPSGSGKTTVLRAIAGFVRPDSGSIVRGESVLVDRASGVFVPPHLRPVRTTAQTARLFPNMTVHSNVIYGVGRSARPENAGTTVDEIKIVDEIMSLFRIQQLTDRRPHQLSGGERQRVSVARAVVSAITCQGAGQGDGAALLLLDEPFSGLDYAMRDQLVDGLRECLMRWKTPVLSVTHDVGEAFQLGAEVIRIAEGKIVQQGPVVDVLGEERLRLMSQLRVGPS
ncbi:ATP-binding cassette domain-containing protein [Tunturibacter empetritectus]|uniref:Molybdate transport system ATP-binding protein n=1 Tax=Tunturiibacter lichenicola TaxID=2051959 RepID=A0A7W8J5H7_9BACT|nr:ATP-binding cassette domain-containing protein [Edaphobacter lichenicola]MBB5343020.1 molybdate transport system ATP-binding protein [Edaphobacter lichenicola]